MAPIKLEDHIREQLEEREIAPSAGAWDKLEAKLDQDKSAKRPLFIWYAIAASIIGVIFIASQFFNNDTQEGQELVVEKIQIPATSEILKTETKLPEESVVKESREKVAIENQQPKTNLLESKRNNSPTKEQQRLLNSQASETRVAVQHHDKVAPQDVSEGINKKVVLSNKVDEVVVAIQKMKQENNSVSAAEIDQLLLEAQRDLATQRILNEVKIDATALLNDVEFEIEKTFRDKVFDALGDSFSIIRTAVVERNN